MSWQDGLDDKQSAAASFEGAHARLLAGPGTGKTLTLTRRVLRLVTESGVEPSEILALVFTRVNAYDLRRSLQEELAPNEIPLPRVSTLHSFALRQLLLNSGLVKSLPDPLRIADDFEEKNIIRPDLGRRLELKDKEVKSRLADMSSDWQSLAAAEADFIPANPEFLGAWNSHRDLYGYTLRAELIWQLKKTIEENPDNFKLEGPIKHVLVDEYQDLNRCDLEIIRMLAQIGAEVFCVGDDDQSIYFFRRAHPEGIRQFPQHFDPSQSLDLEVCWRSEKRIIEIGQFVARQDPERENKPIAPRPGAGEGEVHILRFPEQEAEAAGVASVCRHLIDNEGVSPDEILILLRSDHQGRYSHPLVVALEEAGVPVAVRDDEGTVLDTQSGRLVLSIIRLLVSPMDDLALRTILGHIGRHNGVGEETIRSIEALATERQLRFGSACWKILEDPSLISRGDYVASEMSFVQEIRETYGGLLALATPEGSTGEMVEEIRAQIIDRIGDLVRGIVEDEAESSEILKYILRVAIESQYVDLQGLLAALTSPEDEIEQELEDGKVNILTMHRAKGLSRQAVVLVAAENELIPGDAKGEEFNDARRLLYVSLTRAKEFLYVTYCNERTGRQRWSGSDSGDPVRTLAPFLRGGPQVEDGPEFVASLKTGT